MIATIVIQATEPTGDMLDRGNTLWLNSADGFLYYWNGSSYVKAGHLHPTLEDINFLGDISVGGDEGITGDYQGTFKKITIKKGIITDFELE